MCENSHVTRHTSHVTRHTSHVTRHTSHVTRHTSHVIHHTSHVTPRVTHHRLRFGGGDCISCSFVVPKTAEAQARANAVAKKCERLYHLFPFSNFIFKITSLHLHHLSLLLHFPYDCYCLTRPPQVRFARVRDSSGRD